MNEVPFSLYISVTLDGKWTLNDCTMLQRLGVYSALHKSGYLHSDEGNYIVYFDSEMRQTCYL